MKKAFSNIQSKQFYVSANYNSQNSGSSLIVDDKNGFILEINASTGPKPTDTRSDLEFKLFFCPTDSFYREYNVNEIEINTSYASIFRIYYMSGYVYNSQITERVMKFARYLDTFAINGSHQLIQIPTK